MFLLTVYFFKICPGCTSPCNVPLVNIGMYVRMTPANISTLFQRFLLVDATSRRGTMSNQR